MYSHINTSNYLNRRKKTTKNLWIKKTFYIFAKYSNKKERIMFNQYNHTRTSEHTITMCMDMMMWVFRKPQFL